MSDLLKLSALELGRAIRMGEVSVPEAVEVALSAAGADNAFVTVDGERAMERAHRLQMQAGAQNGPLFGVPMSLKDNICTPGMPTTCGSAMLRNFYAPYAAAAAQRLEQTGTVCIGKTNMDEFGMGSTGETSCFGPVRNPWNAERVAGGSSAGAAAAVARGAGWFALGSDTGGSVRLPAAWCNLTAIKPTYGTVSRYGLVAYASSFDQIGPLCRDAADCAAVLDCIQGKDHRDSTGLDGDYGRLLNGLSGDIRGMRIGLPVQCFGEELDEEVRRATLQAAQILRARGAVVEECRLPALEYALSAYYVISCAQASSNLARYDGVRYGHRSQRGNGLEQLYKCSRSEGFGGEVKRRILLGTFVLSAGYYDAYYKKALLGQKQVQKAFKEAFLRYDLLLTPVSPGSAPKLGESLGDPAGMYRGDIYTVSANLAGLPALSMPCGFHEDGMPVGVQLMGPVFGEGNILNAAHAFQQETDFHKERPAGFGEGGGAG